MTDIAQSWKRIRDWWEKHAPSLEQFGPGANESQLKKLESVLGLKLPADFRESYREVNGSGGTGVFPYGMYLLTLEEIAQQWRSWCEVLEDEGEDEDASESGPFKDVKWNKKWIPFSHSGSGDHDCVDMDPGRTGRVGQVIDFSHEEGPLGITAWSLREWLLAFANDLERGVYQYEEGDGWIARVDGSPRPKYLTERPPETVTFLNLPRIVPPPQFDDAVTLFKEFRQAIRDWKINYTRLGDDAKAGRLPWEELWRLGADSLKKVFDKYCQYTKEPTAASLSYSHASDPEREFPIVGVTGRGKKVYIVIQDELNPGSFRQYEYTLIKGDNGYRVSDKAKIYDPIKKKFVSYYLLGLPD